MTDPTKPTDAELVILRVLWRRGPSTVRDVHDALQSDDAYTTSLKMLQIMHQKRLVTRDASHGSHVYAASVSETEAQNTLVSDLLDRAFEGSAARLAMRALSLEKTSAAELDELRAWIDQAAKGKK